MLPKVRSPSELAQETLLGLLLCLPLAHVHHDAVRHHRGQLRLTIIVHKLSFGIEDVKDDGVVNNIVLILIRWT